MAKVVLDGKEHTLKLDFNAICSFEQITGKSFIVFSNQLQKEGPLSMAFSDMRALLWAGLLNEGEKITLEDVGNAINLNDKNVLTDITTGIAAAIAEAFPKGEATDKKKEEN